MLGRMRSLTPSFFCLLCLTLASAARAQGSTPASAAAMPTDPKELILLAAKVNSLTGDDVKPWHLRASYKVLDDAGNVTDEGTFEEFWASKQKYKTVYKSATFSQTVYATEKGIIRTGGQNPPQNIYLPGSEFVSPFRGYQGRVTQWDISQNLRDKGGMKQLCLEVRRVSTSPGVPELQGPTYCLDPASPMLLSSVSEYGGTAFNHRNIQSFEGHYVPGDVEVFLRGKRVVTAHLESIEALKPADEAEFTPPPDATPLPASRTIEVAQGIVAAKLLRGQSPDYPVAAKALGIAGTVVLQGTIGRDGRVHEIHVVSGPPMLRQAAIDAVQTWRYKPYMLNGEPVGVRTTINVGFALNGR
ncbi:MAG: energy transducer TonB [Terriglobia bacterium]